MMASISTNDESGRGGGGGGGDWRPGLGADIFVVVVLVAAVDAVS